MSKRTYEAPRLEVVEMENMLPIATSITGTGDGKGATINFDDDMEEEDQSELRSSNFFNHWGEE